MCHFLTISVPDHALPDVPDRLRGKIDFSVQNNPSINRLISSDWISFTATSGGCSCDLYRDPKASIGDDTQLIIRYLKKGWSEAKIQRALECRKQTDSHAKGLRNDVLMLAEELLKTCREIRLSLHWYSGNIGTEDFVLHDAGKVSLDDLKQDATLFHAETTVSIKQDGKNIPQAR